MDEDDFKQAAARRLAPDQDLETAERMTGAHRSAAELRGRATRQIVREHLAPQLRKLFHRKKFILLSPWEKAG